MAQAVTLTERAASRIREIVATEPEKVALRIQVLGGGCSGFQYDIALTDRREDDDTAVTRDGATVVIDSTSLVYLLGSEIDFEDSLIGSQFKIHNPNATASCGCGTSFSI
ncbi:MAG: iron-sulfur cluster insertion protein ErpA [Hyphomicrobiales bacterium]